MKQYIIMADIIDSSGKPGKQLMDHFKSVVGTVNRHHSEEIISPLTITLGDEFQGVVKSMKAAANIIFELDELLLKAEFTYGLRFVVNYGHIDTEINTERAYEMLGEGLTQARRLLNNLKSEDQEILLEGVGAKQEVLNMAFKLYRSFYNDWHKKDRPIVATFLEIEDYKAVAKVYNKDTSTTWRREKSLKIEEFKTSKKLITKLIHD